MMKRKISFRRFAYYLLIFAIVVALLSVAYILVKKKIIFKNSNILERIKNCKIFAKIKGVPCAFRIIPFEDKNSGAEELGQMSLFAAPQVNQFFGLAVSFGDEDTYFFKTNEELTSDVLIDLLTGSRANEYITLDLKPQLKLLGMIEKKQNGNICLIIVKIR